jgi:hypothetical protein
MPEYSHEQNLRLAQQMLDQQGQINDLTAERDGAYRERAQLLALLAALHPSVIAPAPDVDEPGWQILYLRIGGRQASWHIAPRDAELLAHVQHIPADDRRAQWDGHTTEEKYADIGEHAARLYTEACGRVETPVTAAPAATQATEKAICPHGCNVTHCPCLACEAERPDEQDDMDQTEPDTITDPEWLKQQYAKAIHRYDYEHGLSGNDLPSDHHRGEAAAVLAVRDRHLQQLRQRLQLADTELQQWAATESADAAAGSYAGRAETAEAVVERVRHLNGRWLAAGPPPLGTPMARWWDKRLAELHQALSEQPPRTTPNNPTTSNNAPKEPTP